MGSRADLVIGVDAGGTKTTAWLGDVDHGSQNQPLGQGHAGPGNPRAVGFDTATQQIAAAIDMARKDAQVPVVPVVSLCLCVAGAGRLQEQERLRAWAGSQQFAEQVTVTNDAEPILAAASPDNIGIALISGTGSLAWGRNADGCVERVGGWGYLFGDEGSGYAIAIAGLRAAVRAADGRGEKTQLLNTFMDRLGVTTPAGFIEGVYGAALSRKQIAACADVVFETALNDDVAQSILNHASLELAETVTTLSQKLGFASTDFVLGLTGGILMHQPGFRSDVIAKVGIRPDHAVNVACPVAGALILAGRRASQYPGFSQRARR
jgi:N-acetylglucosamine kinase-like BadF-type ATPase